MEVAAAAAWAASRTAWEARAAARIRNRAEAAEAAEGAAGAVPVDSGVVAARVASWAAAPDREAEAASQREAERAALAARPAAREPSRAPRRAPG